MGCVARGRYDELQEDSRGYSLAGAVRGPTAAAEAEAKAAVDALLARTHEQQGELSDADARVLLEVLRETGRPAGNCALLTGNWKVRVCVLCDLSSRAGQYVTRIGAQCLPCSLSELQSQVQTIGLVRGKQALDSYLHVQGHAGLTRLRGVCWGLGARVAVAGGKAVRADVAVPQPGQHDGLGDVATVGLLGRPGVVRVARGRAAERAVRRAWRQAWSDLRPQGTRGLLHDALSPCVGKPSRTLDISLICTNTPDARCDVHRRA